MTRVLEVLGQSAGGVARHVAAISGGLHEPGVLEVDVAGPPDLPIEIPRLIHHVVIPNGPINGHRAAIVRIKEVLSGGRYDLVHAHGLRAAIDCAAACRRTRVPPYMSMHNLVRADITGGLKAKLYRCGEA
ncbi:MAG: glycosyltransferase family 4 protein, partial [Actinomycetota bacterium]